jgi:hypothetical protein
VPDNPESKEDYLDGVRRERANLIEQIRRSQQTIEHSQELIKRLDELLARSERKP